MDTPKDIIHWIDRVLDHAQALQASMKQMQIDFNNKLAALREDLANLREKVYVMEQQQKQAALAAVPLPVAKPTAPAFMPQPTAAPTATMRAFSVPAPPAPVPQRRKTPVPKEDIDPMSLPVDLEEAQDLRASPRKRNTPLLVLVATPDPAAPVTEGWLLDRSQGGIGIILDQPVQQHIILRIRPADALPSFRWVRVQVRNCAPVGKRWKIGCSFEERLSAKEMRQFE